MIKFPRKTLTFAFASELIFSSAGCVGSTAVASSPDVVSWIDRNAAPLAQVDATGPVDDLKPLRRIVGPAKVAGLGEPSHGTHEQLTVRHREARFLVEKMGFRTIAWENSWGSGVAVDRYVVTGEGDPRQIVKSMDEQWRSEAMLDLVRWMREFNRGRLDADKVHFLGADVVQLRAVLFEEVRQYVKDVAPARLEELNRHLQPIRYRGESHFRWYFQQPLEARRRFVEHARAARKLVSSLPAGTSRVDRDYAVQHANAIVGFYKTYLEQIAEVSSPVRDRYIADIIGWWHRRTGQKIVYNAANVHTIASPKVTWKFPPDQTALENKTMAGGHLRHRFGRFYVSIGTVSRGGQVLLGWETGQPSVFTVPPAGRGMVDYQLGKAKYPNYLLNLRAEAPEPVRQWLSGPATTRIIGTAYDPQHDADYMMQVPHWQLGFDAILHLDKTTPTRLLR